MSVIDLLRKHWGKVLFFLIISVIILLNAKQGFIIAGNDNFSIEIDHYVNLTRTFLSPAWRSYRALGVASDTEQSDLFRNLVFALSGTVLSASFISQFYILACLAVGGFFTGLISSTITKKYLPQINPEIVFLFSSLIYLFNLKTFHIFYFTLILFIAAWAFFPMFLYATYRFIIKQNLRNIVFLFLSILLLSTSAYTITMFLVMLPVWAIFTVIFFLLEKYKVSSAIKISILLLLAVFGLTAFWTLPFINYTLYNSSQIENSLLNRQMTPELIQGEADTNTFLNTISYRFAWIDTKFGDEYSFIHRDYYQNPTLVILSFLPIIFSIVGLIFLALKKKYLLFLPLVLLIVVYIIFTSGQNTPLGNIFVWFQENIPYFKQVFRWQSSKLWVFSLVPFSILSGIGVAYLAEIFIKSENVIKNLFVSALSILKALVFILIVGVPILVFAFPMISGGLIHPRFYTKIPSEYYELKNYLSENKKSRIYMSPEANTLYFRTHDWSDSKNFTPTEGPGFWGSGFLHFLIPNPLIEKNLIFGSDLSEDSYLLIKQAYYSRDQEAFANALAKYNTQYVLSDRSNSSTAPGYTYDWDLHNDMVETNPNLKKVWSKGHLGLYKVSATNDQKSEYIYNGHNNRRLNQILINANNNVNTVASEKGTGIIYPLAMDFDQITRNQNTIVMSKTIDRDLGEFLVRTPDSSPRDYTKIEINSSDIRLTRALPEVKINGTSISDKISGEAVIPDKSKYLVVGDSYFALDEGKENIVLDYPYEKLEQNVYSVADSVIETNLLDDFVDKEFIDVDGNTTGKTPSTRIKGAVILPANKEYLGISTSYTSKIDEISTIDLEFYSDSPVELVLCVLTKENGSCINKNVSTMVDGNTIVRLPLERVIRKNQVVVINLRWRSFSGAQTLELKKATLASYRNFSSVQIKEESSILAQKRQIILRKGDNLTTEIPLIKTMESIDFSGSDKVFPESSISECMDSNSTGGILSTKDSLKIKAQNCSIYFYPKFSLTEPDSNLGLVYYDADNLSGIPLDIRLKREYSLDGADIYEQKTAYEGQKSNLEFFLIPQNTTEFRLNVNVWGGKSTLSENNLDDLYVGKIPTTWTQLKLEPTDNKAVKTIQQGIEVFPGTNAYSTDTHEGIMALDQAAAKGWKTLNNTNIEVLVINGWEQAFNVPADINSAIIVYTPNVLGYIGYLLLIATSTFFILGVVVLRRHKISAP